MPRVSVIIPTYNRAAYLDEAIQSVIAQTFEDWELIVIDDGSTDATTEVAARYADRITFIRQANAGACVARNLGLSHASGEYVSFLDSDDRMLPNNLADLIAVLEQKPQVDVAYGWYYWMEADGSPSNRAGPHLHNITRPSPWPNASIKPSGTTLEGQILPKLLQEETMLLGTALVRRACVDAVGGFDCTVDFNEHWDFFLSLARKGFEFACCREVVALLRLHDGNRGSQLEKMLAGRIEILDRYFDASEREHDLARVRGSSYYLAYMEYARVYFATDNFDAGTSCLNKALQYEPLRDADTRKLVPLISSRAMHSPSPPELIRHVVRTLAPGPDSRLFGRKLLGKFHAAFAHGMVARRGIRPKAIWHCVCSLWNDPSKQRAKEVARVVRHGLLKLVSRRASPSNSASQVHINL